MAIATSKNAPFVGMNIFRGQLALEKSSNSTAACSIRNGTASVEKRISLVDHSSIASDECGRSDDLLGLHCNKDRNHVGSWHSNDSDPNFTFTWKLPPSEEEKRAMTSMPYAGFVYGGSDGWEEFYASYGQV